MVNPTSYDDAIDNPLKHEGPVKALLRLTATAGLLRSTDARCYARVWVGGRPEVYSLRSAAFRDWLIYIYELNYQETPSDWCIRRVLARLEARARFEGGTRSIFVRVGHDGDGKSNGSGSGNGSDCYLDLADPSGQAVKIGPDGWSVVNNPHVNFRRPDGHMPLPMPSREGAIELLRPYVNVTDRDFTLLVAWMAASLRPLGPYPVLVLYDEHGSAKTTTAQVVRLLIDPQGSAIFGLPGTTRDLMASAVNGWLLAYDNISTIPDWLSDGLCMLSTAGAIARHASFTDSERRIIHAQRPLILSGIEEFVTRGDLRDAPSSSTCRRSLPATAAARSSSGSRSTRTTRGSWEPCSTSSCGACASCRQSLTELPRMADFAVFAEAIGRSQGLPVNTVLSDYNENRHEAAMTNLEDSPVADILIENGRDLSRWTGTPSRLLDLLATLAGPKAAASPRWPKSAACLTLELRRIALLLRSHGIIVRLHRRHKGRVVSIAEDSGPEPNAQEEGQNAQV